MNDDNRYERLFEFGLTDLAPKRAPDRLIDQIKAKTSPTRPRPRWLALIKEPPMRTSSTLAVGSPMARVAAIMVATLLLALMVAGAGLAGSRLLAADAAIVVDQAGGGDFATINEAVAEAEDGDTIVVKPGTYTEAIVIDKDITLRGDGPVAEIVIEAPADGPTAAFDLENTDPFAMHLVGSDATISGLTFRGEPSELIVNGGSPRLEDLVFESVGWAFGTRGSSSNGSSVALNGGTTATIISSSLLDGGPIGVFGGSIPNIDSNDLSGGPHLYLADFGAGTTVVNNDVRDTINWAMYVGNDGGDEVSITLSGNRIVSPGTFGINAVGGKVIVDGNSITGATQGGIVAANKDTQVIGNVLTDNSIALSGSGLTVVDANSISGGGAGIVIVTGSPVVSNNTIAGVSARGMVIVAPAMPILTGNTLCDNGENLFLANGVELVPDDSNTICEDAPPS